MSLAAKMEEVDLSVQEEGFFLFRQPILNGRQQLVGHALLFCSGTSDDGNADINTSVVEQACEVGLRDVIGSSLAFVHVDTAILMSELPFTMPRQRVVLELLESVPLTPEIMDRLALLLAAGYRFAIGNVVAESAWTELLLPLVEMVKVNVLQMSAKEIAALSQSFQSKGKKLLAENVDTPEKFETCSQYGFIYFQGYHFARPELIPHRQASVLSVHVMEILTLIVRGDNNFEIVRSLNKDTAIRLMLLHLVNTPLCGFRRHIDSLDHILLVLGHRQLKHWLQVLLYANQGGQRGVVCSPLMILAATRGKICELLAGNISGHANSAVAFTVGMLSLSDILFNRSMADILDQLGEQAEVRGALISRDGFYGDLLRLVELSEQASTSEADQLHQLLDQLQLSRQDFFNAQKEAFAWGDNIAEHMGDQSER